MAGRKEVFLKKVLQRLYPPAPKAEEKVLNSAVHKSAAATESKSLKLKSNKKTDDVGECSLVGKKVYTVLPPPEDYRPASGDENPEPISTADGTAGDLSGSEESDVTEDAAHVKKKRKRRRGKRADHSQSGRIHFTPQEGADQGHVEETEEKSGQNLEVPEGQERLSKSKKRKLKKKRQKEKLRSLGLVPQSRALEFTYKQDGREEENDEHSQQVEEVLDFLRATWNIYCSDSSSAIECPSLTLDTAESLFTRLSDGTAPTAAISSLYRLRALVGQRDMEQINTVLQELSQTSILNTDETALVCSLFHYWITEVLPMQMEKNT